ncbi:hypothetical protein, partial [Hafnia alvei]|uniref:hypothetical protein n=4 Tax=Enterobacterales TaxID=91347 RepID=UPI001CAA8792
HRGSSPKKIIGQSYRAHPVPDSSARRPCPKTEPQIQKQMRLTGGWVVPARIGNALWKDRFLTLLLTALILLCVSTGGAFLGMWYYGAVMH